MDLGSQNDCPMPWCVLDRGHAGYCSSAEQANAQWGCYACGRAHGSPEALLNHLAATHASPGRGSAIKEARTSISNPALQKLVPNKTHEELEQLYYVLAWIAGFCNGRLPTPELSKIFRDIEGVSSAGVTSKSYAWSTAGREAANPKSLLKCPICDHYYHEQGGCMSGMCKCQCPKPNTTDWKIGDERDPSWR